MSLKHLAFVEREFDKGELGNFPWILIETVYLIDLNWRKTKDVEFGSQPIARSGIGIFLDEISFSELGKRTLEMLSSINIANTAGGTNFNKKISSTSSQPADRFYGHGELGLCCLALSWSKKPEGQWTADERKATNLDQHLKCLIMSVLPDNQMNSVINCLIAKSTWDDLILYHEGLSDVKENFELASLFGKLKYEENLIDNIYETEKNKSFISTTPLSTAFFSTSIVKDFQDNPDDEEDTRSNHEFLNDLEEEY
ncbi:hypothetical protein Tco_1483577 [Tanacetum coccineum]